MLELVSIREPNKADRLTNAVRRFREKIVKPKRDIFRRQYNADERRRYHKRIPQKPGQTSEKRLAPPKYFGTRFRQR